MFNMLRISILVLLISLISLPSYSNQQIKQQNSPGFVSMFVVGDIHEQDGEFKIKSAGNVVERTSSSYFNMLIYLTLNYGNHQFIIRLKNKNNVVFQQLKLPENVFVTTHNHPHVIHTTWNLDLHKVSDFMYVEILDVYNGKLVTINTFKILVE